MLRTACTILGGLIAGLTLAGDLTLPRAIAQDVPPGGVIIVQESNGFPGGEEATELARQSVTIVGQRLRVLDTDHDWALFVSLPDQKVHEVSVGAREFVERPFAYYERYRNDRARALQEQAAEYRRQRERVEDTPNEARALDAEYTRMGGDPQNPGNVVARLERFPQDRRTIELLVDRVPRQVTLERFKIRENNAADPVFDLWTTTDLTLPVSMLAFWQALGTFAPQVTQKLAQVPGVVIECTAVLDTGSFKRRFQSRALEVRTQDIELTQRAVTFDPTGFTAVDPNRQNGGQTLPANAPQVWCMMTGRLLEPGNEVVFRTPDGKTYTIADAQQRAALIRLLGEGREPPFARAPAPSSQRPGGH